MEKLLEDFNFFLLLKYAYRDLSRSYKKILSIIVTLFLSLFILSSILTIEKGITSSLKMNSKLLLGGDVEIDYNKSSAKKELITELSKISIISKSIKFSTMISNLEKYKISVFSRVQAVDDSYPLYGKVYTYPDNAFSKLNKIQNSIIVNENLLIKLNIKINDFVKIQNENLKVVGVIKSVPEIGGAFVFGEFSITSLETIKKLKLTDIGSFLDTEYKVKFKNQTNLKENLKKIKLLFKNENANIKYPEDTALGIKRTVNNFSQFLLFISISSMLIAGIGISNTLLSFLNSKNITISIKKSLGMNSSQIKLIYYFQLLIILTFVSILSYISALYLSKYLNLFLNNFGINIVTSFSFNDFLKIYLVGFFVILIFSIPTISSIDKILVSRLFRNNHHSIQFVFNNKTNLFIILLVFSFICLFSLISYNPIYSFIYFAFFLIISLIFFFISKFMIFILGKNLDKYNFFIKIPIKNLIRTKNLTSTMVVSLGLGITLLTSIGLITSNLEQQLKNTIPEIAPDYFFLGIQSHEKNEFVSEIKSNSNIQNFKILPIVSASLYKINGKDPISYIKKDNASYWVIRNERRISWSNEIPNNNNLLKGKWWNTEDKKTLQISIDSNVARDLRINLGDIITLKIFGKEVNGRVFNLRSVNYQDLNLNFVILINPSFGKNIPHEYVSTIKLNNLEKFNENELLTKFPNTNFIKVSDYFDKIKSLFNKLSISIFAISILTLSIGLIVISSSILVQVNLKLYQNLVFKIIGFSKQNLIVVSFIEFLIIYLSVIFISFIISTIVSFYVVEDIFNLIWEFDLFTICIIAFSLFVFTFFIIFCNNLRFLNPKVYKMIKNE